MISVIVEADDGAEALAAMLTRIVPGAAEGLVRDVVVIGAAGLAREVAEDAGAEVCADFATALTVAKGPWLACLPPGGRLLPGWVAALGRHLREGEGSPARLCAGRGLFGVRRPEGWLAPKPAAGSAVVVKKDFERIARRRGRRLRVLERR